MNWEYWHPFNYNTYLGIHFERTPEGVLVNSSVLNRSKDGDIQFAQALNGSDEIKTYLDAHPAIPCCISINAPEVLINRSPNELDAEGIEKVFGEEVSQEPISEFVVSYSGHYYAFARKDSIASILEPFIAFQDQFISLSLGPFGELVLAQLIHQTEDLNSIPLKNHRFDFTDNKVLISEHLGVEDLTIDETDIQSAHIPAFGVALSGFYPVIDTMGLWEWGQLRDQFRYKLVFQKLRYPVLAVMLFLFLLSAGVYMYYDAENQVLKEKSSMVERLARKQEELKAYVADNQQMLAGVAGKPEMAILCDRVGYTVPEDIQLSRLVVHPPSEARTGPQFLKGTVILRGNTSSPISFTQWVNKLKSEKGIGTIDHQEYKSGNDGVGQGEFEITIISHVE